MTSTAIATYLSGVIDDPNCPYVVTADLSIPLGLVRFSERRPDRFLNVGVAEQMLVGAGAGLAATGHPVIATTFASFALRAIEAFRHLVVYDGLHVVLVGSHSGLSAGPNGSTHHCTDDLGIFGAMERVTCFSPRSASEAVQALNYCVLTPGQYYVRLAKWMPPAAVLSNRNEYEAHDSFSASYGSPEPLDVAIVSHGVVWSVACEAVESLLARGASACAFHIGKFPAEPLSVSARVVLTIEDHSAGSGIGKMASLIIPNADRYLTLGAPWPLGSDDASRLYEVAGLSVAGILRALEPSL
jgi:transketolase